MKLKKGTYYVGDPCYIFDKSWGKVLNSTNYFDNGNSIVKIFNKECFASATAYGDGDYFDNFGRKYFVDSGTIGVLPISLINKDKRKNKKDIEDSKFMHIIEFSEDFKVSEDGGIFIFGDIVINTALVEDEEE